jgi:hypothetical protein
VGANQQWQVSLSCAAQCGRYSRRQAQSGTIIRQFLAQPVGDAFAVFKMKEVARHRATGSQFQGHDVRQNNPFDFRPAG